MALGELFNIDWAAWTLLSNTAMARGPHQGTRGFSLALGIVRDGRYAIKQQSLDKLVQQLVSQLIQHISLVSVSWLHLEWMASSN